MFRTTFRVLFYGFLGFVSGYLLDRLVINRDERDVAAGMVELPPLKTVSEPVAPAPAPPAKKVSAPGAVDDLTRIKGIGPTFARRLSEAGITTFKQLAGTSPEKLREISKIRDWQQPGVEAWLAEAAEFLAG